MRSRTGANSFTLTLCFPRQNRGCWVSLWNAIVCVSMCVNICMYNAHICRHMYTEHLSSAKCLVYWMLKEAVLLLAFSLVRDLICQFGTMYAYLMWIFSWKRIYCNIFAMWLPSTSLEENLQWFCNEITKFQHSFFRQFLQSFSECNYVHVGFIWKLMQGNLHKQSPKKSHKVD